MNFTKLVNSEPEIHIHNQFKLSEIFTFPILTCTPAIGLHTLQYPDFHPFPSRLSEMFINNTKNIKSRLTFHVGTTYIFPLQYMVTHFSCWLLPVAYLDP